MIYGFCSHSAYFSPKMQSQKDRGEEAWQGQHSDVTHTLSLWRFPPLLPGTKFTAIPTTPITKSSTCHCCPQVRERRKKKKKSFFSKPSQPSVMLEILTSFSKPNQTKGQRFHSMQRSTNTHSTCTHPCDSHQLLGRQLKRVLVCVCDVQPLSPSKVSSVSHSVKTNSSATSVYLHFDPFVASQIFITGKNNNRNNGIRQCHIIATWKPLHSAGIGARHDLHGTGCESTGC